MNGRFRAAALALSLALLVACARHEKLVDGTVAIDEAITLSRGTDGDSAIRTLNMGDATIVLAQVDEQLTDVRLEISAAAPGKAPVTMTVENNLAGAGIELAALSAPEDSRVTITLVGPPAAKTPGSLHLRVKLYNTGAASSSDHAALISAARAWSGATDAHNRPASFSRTGLANIDRAIASLESERGDAELAAEARLIRARALQYFKLDFREARAEALRAAQAFSKLPAAHAVDTARANYVEALALAELSTDVDGKDPTPEEAGKRARELLATLGAADSVLGPIERARAIAALGWLDLNAMRVNESTASFELARKLYADAGYVAGERDMRFALPMLLVEQGRFAEAATAYDPLLPELDQIIDPELRTKAYIAVARSQSFSGRVDDAVPELLKILPYVHDHQIRMLEATVLESLGYIYTNRGDLQQGNGFYARALELMREQKDGTEYAFALAAAETAARLDGDLDRALALGEEAVRRSTTPIAKARTPIDLAMVYRAKGDLPRAMQYLRSSLAVDLGDPRHHAFTDTRIYLAVCEIEYEPSTAADLAEARKLLREALETSEHVHDVSRQIIAHRHLGHLDARLGNDAAALASFDRALTLAQALRARSSSVDVRTSMLRDEQFAFRGYLDLVLANVARRGPGVFAAATPAELAAMRRLEDARRASFGALRVGELDAATSAHVDDLLEQMGQKSLRIKTLLDQKGGASGEELQALQLDMSRLHAELDNIRWSAAAKNVATSPAKSAPAWRALAPGTTQLSYISAYEHVYVLARSAGGVRMAMLAPSRQALDDQLAEITALDARRASPEIERKLDEISAALLPPGLLPEETAALEVVAEGRIANVPFAALRSPTDARRRLVDTHDIAMVTSLFAVDAAPRPKTARPYRFVGLASGHGSWRAAGDVDPIPQLRVATKEIGLAATLFTASDAAAKVKLLTGADGNAAALRDVWSSGADVVHFATHALADLRQPIASLLVLPATDAAGRATYLTAGQVQAWRGDTELVFLSACESAVGPPQFAAGMPGLQRAFLRAGARGVIATLAPIEDVLAQQFAADFYARYTRGMSARQALSETQRAWLQPAPGMRAEDQLRRRVTALSHAYFTI